MRLKSFRTHTLTLIKTAEALELEFNAWASTNSGVEIVRVDYFTSKRTNKRGVGYEEIALLVFYIDL